MIDRTLKVEGDMLTGLLVIADKPNIHGIVYPRAVVEKLVKELKEEAAKKTFLVYSETPKGDEIPYRRKLTDAVGFVVDSKILEDGAWQTQIKIINPEFLNQVNTSKLGFNMTVMAGVNTFENVVKDDAHLVDISFARLEDFGKQND